MAWFEAKQLCFNILLVRFSLPMIDLRADTVGEWLGRRTNNPKRAYAWVRIPSVSISFWKRLNWTRSAQQLMLTLFVNNSPKNLSDHKNFEKESACKLLEIVLAD